MINPENIKPVEFKILVEVDEVESQTSGGLLLPDSVRVKQQYAHDQGVLVAISDMAFSDWSCQKPKVGDRVIFNKYAGSVLIFKTPEGEKQFRLCIDKDLCAIIEAS